MHANNDRQLEYTTPALQVLGNVSEVTASGTGTPNENGNLPNCSTNAARSRCTA